MPRLLQLGVVSTVYSTDVRAAIPRARAAGFMGVQVEAYSANLDVTQLSQSGRRELRHLLSANEQQLVALRMDFGPRGLAAGSDVDQAIARLDRAMEAATGLSPGRPLVCVDLGPLPEPARAAAPPRKPTAAEAGLLILPSSMTSPPALPEEDAGARPADSAFESQVDLILAEIGRRADRYSATVAFRAELASFAALERALRAAGCPWFGVDLDPAAVLRDRWTLIEVLDRLGTLVRHVRGRDAVAGHDRRTRPVAIGQGNTNWEEVLALLDEAGYHGWITVDPLELPDRPVEAARGLARLRGPQE